MTTIKSCTCKNTQQDELYGAGNRAYNEATKVWRCTACGKEVSK